MLLTIFKIAKINRQWRKMCYFFRNFMPEINQGVFNKVIYMPHLEIDEAEDNDKTYLCVDTSFCVHFYAFAQRFPLS